MCIRTYALLTQKMKKRCRNIVWFELNLRETLMVCSAVCSFRHEEACMHVHAYMCYVLLYMLFQNLEVIHLKSLSDWHPQKKLSCEGREIGFLFLEVDCFFSLIHTNMHARGKKICMRMHMHIFFSCLHFWCVFYSFPGVTFWHTKLDYFSEFMNYMKSHARICFPQIFFSLVNRASLQYSSILSCLFFSYVGVVQLFFREFFFGVLRKTNPPLYICFCSKKKLLSFFFWSFDWGDVALLGKIQVT